ncbi:MAG: 50S ribosomal protein L25, partial [Bacteroidota bacterium]
MNTVKIIGYLREDFGKQFAKRLRQEAQVPGVLYGGKEQV